MLCIRGIDRDITQKSEVHVSELQDVSVLLNGAAGTNSLSDIRGWGWGFPFEKKKQNKTKLCNSFALLLGGKLCILSYRKL